MSDEHKARVDRLIRHSIPLHTSAMLVDEPASSSSNDIGSWHAGAVTVVTMGMSTMLAGVGFSIRVCLLLRGFSSITPASLDFLK